MKNESMNNYCEIYLRSLKDIFTWHTDQNINVGARVVVALRGRKRIGIVVSVGEDLPKFRTQPIQEILDECFLSEKYIDIAKKIAEENFCALGKVLSLMIPEAFLLKQNPEKREIFYQLCSTVAGDSGSRDYVQEARGEKQKLAVKLLSEQGSLSNLELRKHISLTTLNNLLEKNIIEQTIGSIIDPFRGQRKKRPHFDFTEQQKRAFEEINKTNKPILLFGVTGSGKTEIYKKLALRVLEKNSTNQVLFLIPEIALTSQLIAEFYGLFGDIVAVWHSKLSEGEKIQEFARIISGEARILVGTRSAVFVPLRAPELIILDEEHEWTYKNEFMPRFWTHNVVEKFSDKFGAKLVFGAATPRLESFRKCEVGEWKRVDLHNRVFETKLPAIELIDLKNEIIKGNDSPISERLEEELVQILGQKKQAVIFLNKRGFSGATICRCCGHTFECPDCTNNMKMHQRRFAGDLQQKFCCHICGRLERFPDKCPECRTEKFVFRGWGTQQVEKVLVQKFPGIRVFRADADSITGKRDFENLMDRFHAFEADVLLGTQMVAKGLDFDRVELVGVVLADVGLTLPDFRSEERVFQLLSQVSGRAGRRSTQGRIVIQSFRPEENIFSFLKKHNTEEFVSKQIIMRQKTGMPPFGTVAKITFSDVSKENGFGEAKSFYEMLKSNMSKGGVHFAPAFFPRAYGKYHFHVFLRMKEKAELIGFLKKIEIPKMAKVDIEPVSLL